MKITDVRSHVLQYPLDEKLGYSQMYFDRRTAHIVEIITDEGIRGFGEAFGGGNVALGNKAIVEQVIRPMILGQDPLDRERIWHHVYNQLRDHGQKGMPIQALSGIDIALWDIVGRFLNQPIYKLLGGAFRDSIPVYGYGMMLRETPELEESFAEESTRIVEAGYRAIKMKIGLGPRRDLRLATAVREAIGPDICLMVDANHAYTAREAIPLGREFERLGMYWFEEPVAPEDHQGYRDVSSALDMAVAGGEAEFTRWGFRELIADRCVDILQPETCGLGGITEYCKVLALAHSYFIPVVNHVWGSAIAVATNLHLLAAMPDLPGAMEPVQPMLEYDTTPNRFREELLVTPLSIPEQVKRSGGWVSLPPGPGLGIEVDFDFMKRFEV